MNKQTTTESWYELEYSYGDSEWFSIVGTTYYQLTTAHQALLRARSYASDRQWRVVRKTLTTEVIPDAE